MKKYLSIIITLAIGVVIGYTFTTKANLKNICTNNNTRDYVYEAYCDSIWETDKNYYLDVLTETDEYQLYLEAHGSWWSNNN